ncbi:zinc dependent phospholipase C family protein, partial [Methanobrevibacter sp.]|uniref:zinc dependent phospholipase C family protein n=1 Tax=Methanobrevibacter sp. TaxID=66852 RepID=UPI003890C97E
MPSWGIHLATANEILKKIDVEDKNAFLMGNFLPDAERYVINDFTIFVPYNLTDLPKMQNVEGTLDRLPNYIEFIKKYINKMNNPLVLGYLTHLLTDYYWNKVTHLRYTIRDEDGNCIGLKLNDGTEIEA